MLALMLLMRIVSKFCMKEVCLSEAIEGWNIGMKNGQKLKLGDAHGTPGTCSRSINHQSLGMPPAPSCSSSKCFRSSLKHCVFIRLCNKCLFLERPLF